MRSQQTLLRAFFVLTLAAPIAQAQTPPAARPADPATIVMRDGRRIVGTLVSYVDGRYTLQSAEGEVVLLAKDVARVELRPARGEEPVSAEIANISVDDLLRLISRGHRQVDVDPAVAGRKVSVNLVRVPFEAAVEEIARLADARVELQGGRLCLRATKVEPAPRSRYLDVEKSVKLDVEDVPLQAALDRIGRQVGILMLAEPGIEQKVSATLPNMPWRDVVRTLAGMTKCRVEDRDGALLFSQPPRITIRLVDADVRVVLQQLALLSGQDIVIGGSVQGTSTIDATEQPWDEALLLFCKANGLHVESQGQGYLVSTEPSGGEPLVLPATLPW